MLVLSTNPSNLSILDLRKIYGKNGQKQELKGKKEKKEKKKKEDINE